MAVDDSRLRDPAAALREVARVCRRVVIATTDMRTRRLGVLEEAFPSLLTTDGARFPRIESIGTALRSAGFDSVAIEERPHRARFTVAQQLERVRRKYLSTLDLLPVGEVARGLRFLEAELPNRYPDGFPAEASFTFPCGSR